MQGVRITRGFQVPGHTHHSIEWHWGWLVQSQLPVCQPWLRRDRLHRRQIASGKGWLNLNFQVVNLGTGVTDYTVDKLLQVWACSTSTSSLSAFAQE
jgi:hypothetical protein